MRRSTRVESHKKKCIACRDLTMLCYVVNRLPFRALPIFFANEQDKMCVVLVPASFVSKSSMEVTLRHGVARPLSWSNEMLIAIYSYLCSLIRRRPSLQSQLITERHSSPSALSPVAAINVHLQRSDCVQHENENNGKEACGPRECIRTEKLRRSGNPPSLGKYHFI